MYFLQKKKSGVEQPHDFLLHKSKLPFKTVLRKTDLNKTPYAEVIVLFVSH